MQTDDLIPAKDFCLHHQIEFSFIDSLQQFGLIEVTSLHEAPYIPYNELSRLEQMVRLHYELNINLEGIDVVNHLLENVRSLQTELNSIKNRLKLYEDHGNQADQ